MNNLIIDEITKKSLDVLTSSNSDEHNTPEFLIEAVREVIGHIDLDPMSNDKANKIIRANNYYTVLDNGLTKEWKGNIWLNPPFSLANQAVKKLISSYEEMKVKNAVLLIKSAVDTVRYRALYPYPFCELNGRVKFISDNNKSPAPFATVLFYFGDEYYKWKRVMSQYGRVHPGDRLFTKIAMSCNIDDLRKLGVLEPK